MSAQLELVLGDIDRAMMLANRIRQRLKAIAQQAGHKAIAEAIGCEEGNVSNKLDSRQRHVLHPHELFYLMLLDRDLGVLADISDALGCEPPERKRVIEDAEKYRRVMDVLGEVVGPEIVELIERKAGLT